MKLAMRPRNSPMVPTAQVTSPSERIGMPRLQREQHHRGEQPRKPPWNDMPPFHSCERLERVRGEIGRIVEQHVADAAAEDDAERDPHDEVVEVERGHRRRPAPQARRLDQRARVEPAGQDADDIGERVPADRERSDWISTGSKLGNCSASSMEVSRSYRVMPPRRRRSQANVRCWARSGASYCHAGRTELTGE